MAPKLNCFAGFCDNHFKTASVHTHAYRYPLWNENRFANHRFM